jgi:hypothetical protein
LLPSVKEETKPQFLQAFNEIAQDMNVISVSVRAMLSLSETMCKQIDASEDMRNMEKLLHEEMNTLEVAQKNALNEFS